MFLAELSVGDIRKSIISSLYPCQNHFLKSYNKKINEQKSLELVLIKKNNPGIVPVIGNLYSYAKNSAESLAGNI